jgi:hypothetical protein
LRFDAWLSFLQPREFYSGLNKMRLDYIGHPVWSSDNFDLTYEIDAKNERQINLTLPLSEISKNKPNYFELIEKNKTLYLYVQILVPDHLSQDYDPLQPLEN